MRHIVRIHERMHAFHHCNFFGKSHNNEPVENLWIDFFSISPVYKEFLSQLFTFKCVEKTYLQQYFEKLSRRQPTIYQTWEYGKHLSKQEVYDLYISLKDTKLSSIELLDKYAELYDEAIRKENHEQQMVGNSEAITHDLVGNEKALMLCMAEKRKDTSFWTCVESKKNEHRLVETMNDLW